MSNTDLQTFLIDQEIVTVEQVRHAVAATLGTDYTWLDYLLLSQQLCERELARRVGAHARAPACCLDRLSAVPRDVLAQLPRDLAVEHRMIPLWVEPDGDLCVAMIDPTDTRAVDEVAFFTQRTILREVAPATPIGWALSTYYGAPNPLWPRQELRAPRLARGSVPPMPAGMVVSEPLEVVGRALNSAHVLYEVVEDETGRFVRTAS
jgi:hypothetical protein